MSEISSEVTEVVWCGVEGWGVEVRQLSPVSPSPDHGHSGLRLRLWSPVCQHPPPTEDIQHLHTRHISEVNQQWTWPAASFSHELFLRKELKYLYSLKYYFWWMCSLLWKITFYSPELWQGAALSHFCRIDTPFSAVFSFLDPTGSLAQKLVVKF